MKTYPLTISLVLLLAAAPFAGAQWLTHTPDNSQPPGIATTGAFPTGGPGGYTTATVNILSDGAGNGVPGISPNPFTNVTSTFLSYYSLNSPGNTFDYLNVASNDTRDVFVVTIDFTHLAGGVLPAGSTVAFLDVDNYENVAELTGYGVGGGQYAANWLQQFNGIGTPPAAFDYDNTGGNGIGANVATFLNLTSVYALQGDPSNQDSAFQGFTTTKALTAMSFIYDVTDPTGGPSLINDSYGLAIRAVPEPSAYLLLGLGLLICGQRFIRRRHS